MKVKKHYILTLARSGTERGRSLRLSPALMVTITIAALFLLTGLLFSSIHYYGMFQQSADYLALKSELDELRRSEQGYRMAAKQLDDEISSLEVTVQKLKVSSGFDPDALGGVGGPGPDRNPVLSLSQKDLLRHFKSMDRKRITLETELQQLQDYYRTREILLAATPSLMPVRGYPSDRFGWRLDPFSGTQDFHKGVDISAPRGTKVVASADGLIVFAGRRLGYGKVVTVEHKFGLATRYGHLDRYVVEAGERIRKGDIVGYVGSTGRSTGPHLHYEVRLNNQPLNPLRFFEDASK